MRHVIDNVYILECSVENVSDQAVLKVFYNLEYLFFFVALHLFRLLQILAFRLPFTSEGFKAIFFKKLLCFDFNVVFQMMGTTVKSERHDDAEINEMARRIMEQNRAKVAQQQPPGMTPMGYPLAQLQMSSRPGQPMIQNYLTQTHILPKASTSGKPEVPAEKAIDDDSRKGRFGWAEFEKNQIPYIFRNSGEKCEKYTSVRMVERKLLNKFLSVLPTEVNSCHCIRSYYITDHEAKLLNEINIKHADLHFGKEAFTTKDLVVRMADAKEFYR